MQFIFELMGSYNETVNRILYWEETHIIIDNYGYYPNVVLKVPVVGRKMKHQLDEKPVLLLGIWQNNKDIHHAELRR